MLFVFVLVAMAQEVPPPEERARKLTERLTTILNLTADQVPKVEEINLAAARRHEAQRNEGGRALQKRRRAKAVEKERDRELRRVLTAAQWRTYESKKEELIEELKRLAEQRKQE